MLNSDPSLALLLKCILYCTPLKVMAAQDEPQGTRIQLNVYDLTRGLAAQLSPAFLGKQRSKCFVLSRYFPILFA